MIVKNESKNLQRFLSSVAPHVDCYVIYDTGSTDDTVAVIREFFEQRKIPGLIESSVFQNFAHNRNEALEGARRSTLAFDYILRADADMEFFAEPGWKSRLTEPAYSILLKHAGLEYSLPCLVRRDVPSRYVGVTHEYLDVGNLPRPTIRGVHYVEHGSGGTRPEKFERDLRLLREGLEAEPTNTRYAFYLANSLFDLGRFEEAIAAYERRFAMGGWIEEQFYSMYRIGCAMLRLGRQDAAIAQMLRTFEMYPSRAEPLHAVAIDAQTRSQHRIAGMFARAGLEVTKPVGALFVEAEVYDWRLADVLAVSLYWAGRKGEAIALLQRITPIAPESERARLQKNIEWCRQR